MADVATELDALRKRIAELNEPDTPPEFVQRLAVTRAGDLFDLDFFGESFEEAYEDLMATAAQPEVSPGIRSLTLRGPDEGANGTNSWELDCLLNTDAVFQNLQSFRIQLNEPGNHNRSVVASGENPYEESGLLSQLLAKSPNLQNLVVPSAPNKSFFEVGVRPIRHLSIDAGYDCQEFIANLANSTSFPNLYCLEWGEYSETYLEDYTDSCTPEADYRLLFESEAFKSVNRFVWRNPVTSQDVIALLKQARPDLQLLIVRYSQEYA